MPTWRHGLGDPRWRAPIMPCKTICSSWLRAARRPGVLISLDSK